MTERTCLGKRAENGIQRLRDPVVKADEARLPNFPIKTGRFRPLSGLSGQIDTVVQGINLSMKVVPRKQSLSSFLDERLFYFDVILQ